MASAHVPKILVRDFTKCASKKLSEPAESDATARTKQAMKLQEVISNSNPKAHERGRCLTAALRPLKLSRQQQTYGLESEHSILDRSLLGSRWPADEHFAMCRAIEASAGQQFKSVARESSTHKIQFISLVTVGQRP